MTTKKYLFSEEGDALKYKGTDRTFDLIYKNINMKSELFEPDLTRK